MQFNELGKTGIQVSKICLGTMTYGEQNTEAEAHEQLDYAVAQGINFFDTAEMYPVPPMEHTQGKTEEYIGSWFKKTSKRNEIILATKVAGPGMMSYLRGGAQLIPEQINAALEASLKRLQTDYIDLYQLHWPNRSTYHFRQSWLYSPSTQHKQPDYQIKQNMVEVLEKIDELIKVKE